MGASVLAHNSDGEQESPKDAVAAKVAESLGVDEQAYKDAVQEATQEVRSHEAEHRLDAMVEAGRLTQEQADQYLEALEEGPEAVRSLQLQLKLDKMVEAGRLTQAQADEYKAWYESQPEGLELHRGGGHRIQKFGGGGEREHGGPAQRFGGFGGPQISDAPEGATSS